MDATLLVWGVGGGRNQKRIFEIKKNNWEMEIKNRFIAYSTFCCVSSSRRPSTAAATIL